MPMGEDKLTPRERGHIEGYAAAMDDLYNALTGDSFSGKSYDPMTIEGGMMHSYAFDLKDGGRHHPLSDYESVEEICGMMLFQTTEAIKGETSNARIISATVRSRAKAGTVPSTTPKRRL